MSDLIEALKRVQSGDRSFKPAASTTESLVAFQSLAKALILARDENLLERCEFSKESYNGDLYYNAVLVIGGLSYKGADLEI